MRFASRIASVPSLFERTRRCFDSHHQLCLLPFGYIWFTTPWIKPRISAQQSFYSFLIERFRSSYNLAKISTAYRQLLFERSKTTAIKDLILGSS